MREGDQLIGSDRANEQTDAFSENVGLGVHDYLSVSAGLARISSGINQPARNYKTLALQMAWPSAATQLEVARENSGDHGTNFTLFSRVFEQDFRLEVSEYNGLISDENINGDLQRDAELSWVGNRRLFGLGFNYSWVLNEIKRRTSIELRIGDQ